MKKTLFLFLFLMGLKTVQAQNGHVISGEVIDSLSRTPLVGAIININYGELNIVTDNNGKFEFIFPRKEVIVVVRYVGYKPFRTSFYLNKDYKLEIKILQISNDLEEVIVSSKNNQDLVKRPLLGVNTLSIGEIDILRGLQMLPGVTSVGEAANGVNIRGGATDQNLILLDDAPIFNPTHMFGLFSAFPSDAISSFDLYKGNVPTRFGGRAAAVLDVSLANPNLEKFKLSGGISLVSNRVKLEIPVIKDRLGIMITGRGAFNDWLLPLASDKLENIKAKFGDGASKIFFRANQKNTFTLSSYYSKDFFQTDILGSINEINSTKTQYDYSTINNTLNWFYAINKNLNLQTKFITSDYAPNTVLPELNSSNKVKIKSGINYKQVKTNINYFKGKHKLESGFDGIKYVINPGELDPGTNKNIKFLKTQKENAYEFGAYIEDEIEVNPKLTVTGGLRYSYFLNMGPLSYRTYQPGQPIDEISLIDTLYLEKGKVLKNYGGFEPRFGLRYQIDAQKSIKIGLNLMRQYLQVITNTTTPLPTSRWKTSDLYIKPQVSTLYTIGYFQELSSNIYEYSVEAYLRNTNNIVDYKPGADFLLKEYTETQLLQGINKSYGLEGMISKKKGEMTGWLNYTYSRSLNKVNEGTAIGQNINQGAWYRANYDRPHSFNATVILNQGTHHDFSFNFTYSTGRPFTLPSGYILFQEKSYPFYDKRNNARIPDYHRLDFAWNIYNPSMDETKRWKGNWTFTIYNLYGRKNAYSVFLKTQGQAVNASKLTIFGAPLASLSYNFKFS
jgi:CarboxypepD_reg-like domain/TonB-dependent Receptor Plug Domain